MFSQTLRRAFTAASVVLAITASSSLGLARSSDGDGHPGKGPKKNDSTAPVRVSTFVPSKGMASPWFGNHVTNGNNSSQPIIPGNPRSAAMAATSRDNNNGNAKGHGKDKGDPAVLTIAPAFVFSPPSKGMASPWLGNHTTNGNNSSQPIIPDNPRSQVMAAASSDNNNGKAKGHGKDKGDPAVLTIAPTFVFSPPSKGMADPWLGNHTTNGNNSSQPIIPGNPRSEVMAAASSDNNNGKAKGHGKDKGDPSVLPLFPSSGAPYTGMPDRWRGDHTSSGNNPSQPIIPDNPRSAAMSAALGSADLGASKIFPPASRTILGSSSRPAYAASFDRTSFGRATLAEAPVAVPSILPRILDHSSFQLSRDGEQGLQAAGAWTLAF